MRGGAHGATVPGFHGAMVLVLGATVLGATMLAQAPISNARVETRTVARGLEQEVSAVASRPGASWIAYRVAKHAGPERLCCWDNGRCALEDGGSVGINSVDSGRVMLEPPAELLVFARVEQGRVGKLRMFTPDCSIDAGGMPVVWLEGVDPTDSVAWLAGLVASTPDSSSWNKPVVNPALGAIAMHAAPEAVTTLIKMAKDDASSRVRGQALFWLANRAGREAIQAITAAIEDDPDTEVKKKAVFALSQMPKDDGVPKLIQVARTNRNPAVRKQAMFWLGESRDPRALQFFEEILLPK